MLGKLKPKLGRANVTQNLTVSEGQIHKGHAPRQRAKLSAYAKPDIRKQNEEFILTPLLLS